MELDVFSQPPFVDLSPSVFVLMKPLLHLDLEADYVTLNAQLNMLLTGGLIST